MSASIRRAERGASHASRVLSPSLSTTQSLKRSRRPGFTLLEMLVVVAIIAMLAGLVSVAAFGVLGQGRITVAKTELDQIALGMKQYKDDRGAYPPCFGLYSSIATLHQATILAHVRRAFPQYDPGRTSPGDGDMVFGEWADFAEDVRLSTLGMNPAAVGDETQGLNVNRLDQAEALVFWLAGNPGQTESKMIGFHLNPQNPFQTTKPSQPGYPNVGERSKRLFDFDPRRLVDRDEDGWLEYIPNLPTSGGDPCPYVYFDALAYTPVVDATFEVSGAGFPKLMPYPNDVAGLETAFHGKPATYSTQWGRAWPMLSARRDTAATPPIHQHRWVNTDSFQLICAGVDGSYGGTDTLEGLMVFHEDLHTLPTQTHPIFDNLTNFTEKTLKDFEEGHQ